MSDNLPPPLVPADLRDFGFMPLWIARLQKSKAWLRCKRRPELAFYMLNLWMRAWHEVPAGSIEDDDDVLADAAMADPRRWTKIKDDVLQGWERCDGRLFHPVVTELATEAWRAKQDQRQRTEAARQAKSQRQSQSLSQTQREGPTDDATLFATDPVTASKGEGEGKRELRDREKEPPKAPRKRVATLSASNLAEFESWYEHYPRHVGRGAAERAFLTARKLASLQGLTDGARRYAASITDEKFTAHPATWLNQRRWTDEPSRANGASPVPGFRSPRSPPPVLPGAGMPPDEVQ